MTPELMDTFFKKLESINDDGPRPIDFETELDEFLSFFDDEQKY